jgi:hypothetical protein
MKAATILVTALIAVAVAAPPMGSSAPKPKPGGAMKAMTTGVFDTGCKYSHSLPDDPLLYPNEPGASHLHDFFGNKLTTARTSGSVLVNAAGGNPHETTCKDEQDDSAYWTPSLFQDGAKVRPENMHIYYRHRGTSPAKPFPVGFGMITHRFVWWCGPGSPKHSDGTVPACSNHRLFLNLVFPDCWDGVHKFAADGSHVSFGMKSRCDAAHPVVLPRITIFLSYRVDGKAHRYVLASGAPSSAHGDFLNAWQPQRLAHLVDKCLNHGRVDGCKDDKDR